MRRGKPGADSPTLLVMGTPGFGFRSGEVWAAHVAWSGDTRWMVERLPELAGVSQAVLGGGELLRPGEIRLRPGEEYRTPTVVFGWAGSGLDELAGRMHSRQRRQLSYPSGSRPLALNTWEAVYFDHDIDQLSELVDRAAEVGVERVVLDDGWFLNRRSDDVGLGDWIVDPKVWPQGLHPLVDRVRRAGMSFGLWVEPEMISLDSELARKHPDWVLAPRSGLGLPSRQQYVLDIGRSEVWQLLLERISALAEEYQLDYLKWDHNRDLLEAVTGEDGTDKPAVHCQTVALYALLDELHRRHPALEIESCSAGGGRVDLGIMAHAQRLWVTDCNDPVEREVIQQWTGLLLPPELLGTHLGAPVSHTTHRYSALSFQLASALFGHAGIERDLTTCDDATLQRIAAWVALYKELRLLLHSGRTVHADLADTALLLHGVVSTDRSHALYAWTSLATPMSAHAGRVQLPGLDPTKEYLVRVRTELGEPAFAERVHPSWFEDAETAGVVASGAILTEAGVPLPTLAPASALLLEVIAR
jgi:alpha-galactosidase